MPPPTDPAPPWLIPLIFVAFPIFFVAMWSFVCLLLSMISGWRKIAERFPGSATPTGTRFPMVTGAVGVMGYRNCLKVHVAPEGLHIAVWKMFRFGHPPLFIPWSEIRNATTRKLFFAENIVFEIGSPKVGKIQLPKKVFEGQPISIDGQRAASGPPPLH
jgi:hypothetical protein